MSIRLYTENNLKLSKIDSDKIRCSICLDTVFIATGSENCSHIFCKDCITNSYKINNRNCPECQKSFIIQSNKYFDQSNIYNLTYECTNGDCQGEFVIGDNYRNITAHNEICPGTFIECRNCKTKVVRNNIKAHKESNECKKKYIEILENNNNKLVQTERKYNNLKRKITDIHNEIHNNRNSSNWKYPKFSDEYYRGKMSSLVRIADTSIISDSESSGSSDSDDDI